MGCKNPHKKKNNALANFEFVSTINKGDIIIVKKGSDELIGYGEVVSDYYYDENTHFAFYSNSMHLEHQKA